MVLHAVDVPADTVSILTGVDGLLLLIVAELLSEEDLMAQLTGRMALGFESLLVKVEEVTLHGASRAMARGARRLVSGSWAVRCIERHVGLDGLLDVNTDPWNFYLQTILFRQTFDVLFLFFMVATRQFKQLEAPRAHISQRQIKYIQDLDEVIDVRIDSIVAQMDANEPF